MRRNYLRELSELSATYNTTLANGASEDVRAALIFDQPMAFVGSGGALAVAQLAADLHTFATGHLAVALTPLESASAPLNSDTGFLLFTARGRNPDAGLSVDAARQRGAPHIGILSSKDLESLPHSLTSGGVRVGTIPAPADGFLATNSLLAMAAGICLAHDIELPPSLPAIGLANYPPVRRSIIAVSGPGTRAVALDIEARFVETGLANVQLADYRNLAHGRHVGMSRNAPDITILAVVDDRSERLASRTLRLIPESFDVVHLKSTLQWPASVLDQLVSSMKLLVSPARSACVDPGQPGVAGFGRRLYRMPVRRLVDMPMQHPIDRKLGRRVARASALWDSYLRSFRHWLKEMHATAFTSLVLDYDGTVCDTEHRFDPPATLIQSELIRLLECGVVVGFATGRGKSLHDTTRAWLPEKFWRDVHVGMYNGTCLLRLSDDPPPSNHCSGALAMAADHLEASAALPGCRIERRTTQVSVSQATRTTSISRLSSTVRSVLASENLPGIKVVVSGHAVDIIPAGGGKTSVIESVSLAGNGPVLAIGDQGHVDGNDFEMLSSLRTTLSVDRCSEDPSRCWNLDQVGSRGPDLLAQYLAGLRVHDHRARFSWRLV